MGQNAEQYKESQHLGSVEMFVATYAAPTTFTKLGIGEGFGYTETITPLDGTPDNGEKPDILYGVADQTVEATGTLWSYNFSMLSILRGGIDDLVTDTVTGATTLSTGGLTAQLPVVIKTTQATKTFATAADVLRWVTTPSAPTVSFIEGASIIKIITTTFFKMALTSGEAITYTADNDANPILKYPFTLTGSSDATIVDGTGNLFERVETVALPA